MDLNLAYIQAELQRLDVALRRAIQRWQLAGQDPLDSFRGLYVSDQEVNNLLVRPVASNWGDLTSLPDDQAQAFEAAEQAARAQSESLLETARAQGYLPRLAQLAASFELDEFETNVILLCLAPAIDLRYERLYAYLQDDVSRKRPTVNLALDLLCEPGIARMKVLEYFGESGRLLRHAMVERSGDGAGSRAGGWLHHVLLLDQTVQRWLLGEYQPAPDLQAHFTLDSSLPGDLEELLAGQELAPDNWRQSALQTAPGVTLDQAPLIALFGPDFAAHRAAARILAQRLGTPLLQINLDGLFTRTDVEVSEARQGGGSSGIGFNDAGDRPSAGTVLRLALRDARLLMAMPLITGWDACLERGQAPAGLLRALFDFPGPLIISSRQVWQPARVARSRSMLVLAFGIPAYPQRLALWQYFVSNLGQTAVSEGASTDEAPLELSALAGQFLLTSGQIRDAVASAQDLALQDGVALNFDHLSVAARMHSNPQLSSLARKIVPRYTWTDIILPSDQRSILHEMIETVRRRSQVLEAWGVGEKLVSSRGVTALFAGPPGTGKTMAAEIIARELGLDLYKIELSAIVSKYIGETEKNLERIFNEAEASNAILFFDEADSLFGKRSEVRDSHDRYANIEISYLLQRMEGYDGVTILATNLRANLDEAFTRRLQFAVDFPFPEEADRLRIWQSLFPPGVPRQTDINFNLLARRFKLAGGNIRNILVGAAYLAAADGGRVGMSHLLHSTRRELQKMGRLVGDDDLLNILGHDE